MRPVLACALLLVVPTLVHAEGAKQPPVRIAVLDLEAPELDAGTLRILNELVLVEAQKSGAQVVGMSDLRALASFDRSKALLGCDDDSCLAELGGALGVDKLVVGSIGRVDGRRMLAFKLVNVHRSLVENRLTREVAQNESLTDAVRDAVEEVLRPIVPDAPGPSIVRRWWFWTGVGAVAAGVAAALVVGRPVEKHSTATFTVQPSGGGS